MDRGSGAFGLAARSDESSGRGAARAREARLLAGIPRLVTSNTDDHSLNCIAAAIPVPSIPTRFVGA